MKNKNTMGIGIIWGNIKQKPQSWQDYVPKTAAY